MLLRPASNHRILLCSPNTAPPRGPARPMINNKTSPSDSQCALRGHNHPRRSSSAPACQRGTREDRPTQEQMGASRRHAGPGMKARDSLSPQAKSDQIGHVRRRAAFSQHTGHTCKAHHQELEQLMGEVKYFKIVAGSPHICIVFWCPPRHRCIWGLWYFLT
ncbi:hypothetical protein QR46_4919 [Giardia duodenalis assemblage B]|uniref:Uncharacterized protein n=1 Tax=Giardia duodenalis assemblage B TaxID=1394984 RepID=A0A132NM65_GIAIN|nr:hypothetical protein QR46_4919 [Giardia intestinalis assemblage B]